MSYCVNCGVELDASAKECPLCNTAVINPAELEKIMRTQQPFPATKGPVEAVKRKDLGLLVSLMVLATAAGSGILNALVFRGTLWSLAVIGGCVILWVILIPVIIYVRQPVYISLLFDGLAVIAYLYMLTYMTATREWFSELGVPVVLLATAVAEAIAVSIRKLPKSFLTVALYLFTGTGILCLGLEILIDRYINGHISLSWSAVVLTVTVILDIAIITVLSRRRLRNAVRRRLHF